MASYLVRLRMTGPLQDVTVEANSRDQAIAQVAASVAEGDSVEVLDAKELVGDAATPTKASKEAHPAPAQQKK